MIVGDILKYTPTSTVGKVIDIRNKDEKVWIQLDFTKLYYDSKFLIPADKSEYKEVSYKEREKSVNDFGRDGKSIEEIRKMENEVDISDFMPSGGG